MRPEENTPQLRQTVYTALTGQTGDITGTSNDLRTLFTTVFGTGPRGGVNTRAVAAAYRVSQRTVERWMAPEGRRQGSNFGSRRLAGLRRRARNRAEREGPRRQALQQTAGDRPSRYGAKLRIFGQQGPRRAGEDYTRRRGQILDLSAPDVIALREAYATDGSAGAVAYLERTVDERYLDGWQISSIEEMDLNDPTER